MNAYEEHMRNFLKVREFLRASGENSALAMAFHKPVKWYGEHSQMEAVKLLREDDKDSYIPCILYV